MHESINRCTIMLLQSLSFLKLTLLVLLATLASTKHTVAIMAPTLYHVPRTISSPIYQALLELGIADHPIRIETLTFADLKTPEHLARNPMGSSPAFTDDEEGVTIWESGAVLTYLLETYDTDYKLHPQPGVASQKDRANFLHLQQYIIATVYPFVASLFLHTLKPQQDQDQDYVATATEKWKTLLAPTLVQFLGDKAYFMGDTLSAIDLLAAKPFNNANSLGILEEFPTLAVLFAKVQALPSFAQAYNVTLTVPQEEPGRSMVLLPGNERN